MEISRLSPGPKIPEEVHVLVEIPQGGNVKYELDKESGFLMVDRFLHTAMNYPFNYGFIPGTLSEDGDPVDVCVLSNEHIVPGAVITVRPIGMLEMEDESGLDTKVVAVPKEKLDPFWGIYKEIGELPESYQRMIKHFWDHMKELEPNKWVKTGEYKDRSAAYAEILKAIEYAKKHPGK